jgi:hypothetical protein
LVRSLLREWQAVVFLRPRYRFTDRSISVRSAFIRAIALVGNIKLMALMCSTVESDSAPSAVRSGPVHSLSNFEHGARIGHAADKSSGRNHRRVANWIDPGKARRDRIQRSATGRSKGSSQTKSGACDVCQSLRFHADKRTIPEAARTSH